MARAEVHAAPTRTYVPPWDAPGTPVPEGFSPADQSGTTTLAPLALRWRVLSLLILVAYAVCFARELAAFHHPDRWLTPALVWAALLLQAGAAALAWAGPPGSGRLRLVEWGSLVVACCLLAGMQFEQLTDTLRPAPRPAHGVVGQGWSLPWFALIVAYGALSPTPRPRRLAWAAGLAALPLAVSAVCLASNPAAHGDGAWSAVAELGVWTGTAVALAAFGSHRLDRLRDPARSARRLGQYRLLRRLGGGGMGEVFLAEHALLRRPCAVKLICPERAGDLPSARRFEREVQAMASLTHWNTADVFDYGHTEDGTFYYVMEYLPGLTLEELVHRFGPMPPARVLHLLRQVCGALREAHEKGLVHRDLKPSNVMVCERGGVPDVVKLLDFGLVRAVAGKPGDERLTGEGTVLGTPAFMSPEQAAGRPMDARGDLYALGATAFFLLTGRAPFERATPMQVLAAHLLEPAPPASAVLPGLPGDLEEVILRCLAKHPADRFADVRDLERALAACRDAGRWSVADAEGWWATRGGCAGLAETPPDGLPAARADTPVAGQRTRVP